MNAGIQRSDKNKRLYFQKTTVEIEIENFRYRITHIAQGEVCNYFNNNRENARKTQRRKFLASYTLRHKILFPRYKKFNTSKLDNFFILINPILVANL